MYQQSISSAFLIKTSFFYSGWKIFIANRLPNQQFLDNEEDILRATQHTGQIGSLLEFQVNSWSSKLVPKYCENLSTLVLDITDDVLTVSLQSKNNQPFLRIFNNNCEKTWKFSRDAISSTDMLLEDDMKPEMKSTQPLQRKRQTDDDVMSADDDDLLVHLDDTKN